MREADKAVRKAAAYYGSFAYHLRWYFYIFYLFKRKK